MGTYDGFQKFMPEAPLKKRVLAFLEKLIIDGLLKPRQHLIETEISCAIGVSRPPIREALRALEVEGLVISVPNRGFTVTEFTEKDVKNVYLIRATLERLAFKLATAALTPKTLDALESVYRKMAKAVDEENLSGYFDLNHEFHSIILQAVNNEQLTKIILNLGKQVMFFRKLSIISTPGTLRQSLEMHRSLLDALRSGDGEKAGQLRYQQIHDAGQIFTTQIHKLNLISI